MFVIIGLGNPGLRYENTRHNAGMWFVDQISDSWKADSKYGVLSSKVTIAGLEVLLLKPQRFMNLSGEAVAPLLKYMRILPSSVLVAHDELDLPCGQAHFKKGGGHAGHNGLRDIMLHYSADFLRLRIGIDHPGDKNMVSNYVLEKPKPDEYEKIIDSITWAYHTLPQIIQGKMEGTVRRPLS